MPFTNAPQSALAAPPPTRSGRSSAGLLITAFVVGTAALATWWIVRAMGSDSAADQGVLYHTVSRNDLQITVTDDGTLESAANVDIKCELEGGGTILWLVEDGKVVKEGEKLVELDTSALTDQYNLQKSVTAKALAAKIQAEQNQSAAEKAVLEYKMGTFIQEKQTAEAQIQIAQQNLSSAQSTVEFTRRMVRKGFATPKQLEADEFAVKRSELDLKTAELALQVLEEFTYDKMVGELEAAVEAAKAQVVADVATYENELSHLNSLEKQIERAVIYAPQPGMVVYANDLSGRGRSSEPAIEEGALVRERQTILRLPDLSRMQVKTTVHESKVNQIQPGLPARVIVLGQEFDGSVVSIANQPEPNSWFSANVKEYPTIVSIEGVFSDLRPGMTAEVELLICELKDVVTLPVTAVVEKRSGFVCYVATDDGPQERPLILGRTNDTYIEIKDGVKEGDVVIRNPRAAVPEALASSPTEESSADPAASTDSQDPAAEGDAANSPPPASGGDRPDNAAGSGTEP